MQKVFVVRVVETAILLHWHIVVHHKVNFGHIDSASEYVRGDQCREVTPSEIVNDLITLIDFKATNDDS